MSPTSVPSGIWYYKGYVDSTILTKKIYDYSWSCASFAYEVTIDNKNPDSCYFRGYHEGLMLPIKKINDSMYHAGADTTQYWILTFETESRLTLQEHRDKSFSQPADPHRYILEKHSKRITDIKAHFVKNILCGVYRDSSKEVTFYDDYKVTGLDSFVSFDIEIDFWEMVPQMDIIYFRDANDITVQYNWSFNRNELILKKVHNIRDENGDYAGGVADTIVYKLEKIK